MEKNKEDFVIDLRQIEGDGKFSCPGCGVLIDPNDDSKEVYEDPEPVMKGEKLVAAILKCKKCCVTIKLVGFEDLD